ncbi:hypothetical protein VTL71DRAFT_10791 [Oculimacula yallundae]|uniref:Alpha-L-rhamnosidase C-terminal domain-containing protein n=1 Tax=Oculimacula yallundae TaxID=86028 RepID=A0ABR4CUG6_9HELO
MFNAIFYVLATVISIGDIHVVAKCLSCSASPIATGTQPGSFCNETFTLKSNGTEPSILIIDHGVNVGGFPTFKVLSLSGDTSVFEATCSETRALLDNYMGDGPIPLAAALDTYRVNRYNITQNQTYINRLIQGAQRYQKFNLSSAGELTLSHLGVITTVSTTPPSNLPGSFQCSDETFNQIWLTGARTVQQTEIPARVTPEFYQISEEGMFAESQAPQPYSSNASPGLMQYRLDFSVKPVVGGFGYTVLSDTLGSGIYVFVDVGNASISAHAGSTERASSPLIHVTLDPVLALGQWHNISTTVNSTRISVTINNQSVLDFTQTSSFFGSFGLGASFNQEAYYRHVTLKDLTGQLIYNSSLTEASALADFLAGTNSEPVSVDGARRDRIAYAGDLDIVIGPTFASTSGSEYINGSINLLGSSQLLPGFFVPNAKIQQKPRNAIIQANRTGLIGYSFNLVTAMAEFYLMTGDQAFAKRWSPAIVKMLDWADSQVNSDGLYNISDPSLGGDWNYYDPVQSGAVAKFNTLYAYTLQQIPPILEAADLNTQVYVDRLVALRKAINANLWNLTLQAYQLSNTVQDTLSQDANAFAVLAHLPEGNFTTSTVLSTMAKQLFVPAGSLAFSNASITHGFTQSISPYASGYHLRAAFEARDTASVHHLLSTMWASMASPSNTNYTGCFWETLSTTGGPGLGDGTSMCHAWASAPTGELSRNVLGIQAASPGFAQWSIIPQTLGLNWAIGSHPTPFGSLTVSWAFDEQGKLSMNVTSPVGTNGTVNLPSPMRLPNTAVIINGEQVSGSSFKVTGAQTFELTQADLTFGSAKKV